MALVVASTSSLTINPFANTGVITKPTGVAVGDLLILIGGMNNNPPDLACSGFTSNLEIGTTISSQAGLEILFRVATASDVAASNYTVTGTSIGGLIMMRVTGWTGAATTPPIFRSHTASRQYSTSSPQVNTATVSLDVPSEQLIIIGVFDYGESNNLNSAFSLTPSAPTFTTLGPLAFQNPANTRDGSLQILYGIRTSTSTITQYSFTSDNFNTDPHIIVNFLAVIADTVNQTGTNALLEVSPVTFANTAVEVGGTGTNALFQATPQVFSQTGKGSRPPQWVNEAKPSTSWTNETL